MGPSRSDRRIAGGVGEAVQPHLWLNPAHARRVFPGHHPRRPLHFNGICPRAYPSAINGDWPLRYGELVPYYERVAEFLPVSLVRDLATKDALFAAGCEAIGLSRSEAKEVGEPVWRPSHNAILPIAAMGPGIPLRHPEVEGCTMCGHCLVGCNQPMGAPLESKDKRATNVSYVPAAVATGNCEIVPDAFATAILFEEGRNGRSEEHTS